MSENENLGTNPYNVDDFIANLNNDRKKTGGDGNYNSITKVLMNVRDNQGTLIMLPFMNKFGGFYSKIKGVKEWNGPTSLVKDGWAWYKILPREFYPKLTPEQLALYSEVVGYYDALDNKKIGDKPMYSYDKIRYRNYSLLYGVTVELTSTEGKKATDLEGKPCLYMYPSTAPIDSLADAIAQKVLTMKGKKDWIPMVLGVTNKNRHGGLAITFKKGDIGYNATVGFELNSPLNTVVDSEKEVIADDKMSYFSDPIADFMGWQNGKEVGDYFNEVAFRELRDNLKLTLAEIALKEKAQEEAKAVLENKNGTQDAMKVETPAEVTPTPAPIVNSKSAIATNAAAPPPVEDDLPF